jgi:hypothetical protein
VALLVVVFVGGAGGMSVGIDVSASISSFHGRVGAIVPAV